MRLPTLPVPNRKALLVIGILTALALLVTTILMYIDVQEMLKTPPKMPEGTTPVTVEDLKNFLCDRKDTQLLAQVYYLAPLLGFIIVLGGTLAWYFTGARMERTETTLKHNTRKILDFLSEEEKAAINHLMQKGGSCPQYELAHLPDTNKVKMHRILTKIEKKGIIKRERSGKTNLVVLDKELYDVLKQ
jgi:uncharacterized membrane protein